MNNFNLDEDEIEESTQPIGNYNEDENSDQSGTDSIKDDCDRSSDINYGN